MDQHGKWIVAPVLAGALGILTGGLIAFSRVQERKEVPDHAGFQACRACHADKYKMWESSNHGKAVGMIVRSNPAATDCGGCHAAKKPGDGLPAAGIEGTGKTGFHKEPCLACHALQKTAHDHRVVVDPEKLCEACHTQRSVFLGLGAKGIEDSRNFHSGVPCVSCHMNEGNHRMKVIRPDDPGLTGNRQDTCTACHMDNNREARVRQIQEWQSTYDESMAPLLADVNAIDAALKKKPDLLNAALKTRFEGVKTNLSILEKDGSRGFHNFVFSLEITSLAAGDLKEIKAALK